MTVQADADVAIVGYGPVGATLAVLLGQLGRSVAVLERWPEPYPLPRAVHFDDEVGRIFQSCGIGEELRRITEPADIYEWRNAAGFSHTQVSEWIREGYIPSAKIGKARRILESPREFLERHRDR